MEIMSSIHKFFLCTLLAFSACSTIPDAAKQMVGHEAPSTRLTTLEGDLVSLDEYRGKDIAVLFWATWCSHSRPAVEAMEELAKSNAGMPDTVFWLVSVDKADKLAELKSRIAYQDLDTVKHAFSGNDVYDEAYTALHGRDLPYFVVIDKKGIVRVVADDIDPVREYLATR